MKAGKGGDGGKRTGARKEDGEERGSGERGGGRSARALALLAGPAYSPSTVWQKLGAVAPARPWQPDPSTPCRTARPGPLRPPCRGKRERTEGEGGRAARDPSPSSFPRVGYSQGPAPPAAGRALTFRILLCGVFQVAKGTSTHAREKPAQLREQRARGLWRARGPPLSLGPSSPVCAYGGLQVPRPGASESMPREGVEGAGGPVEPLP